MTVHKHGCINFECKGECVRSPSTEPAPKPESERIESRQHLRELLRAMNGRQGTFAAEDHCADIDRIAEADFSALVPSPDFPERQLAATRLEELAENRNLGSFWPKVLRSAADMLRSPASVSVPPGEAERLEAQSVEGRLALWLEKKARLNRSAAQLAEENAEQTDELILDALEFDRAATLFRSQARELEEEKRLYESAVSALCTQLEEARTENERLKRDHQQLAEALAQVAYKREVSG